MQDWNTKLGKDPQKRADTKYMQPNELREQFGMYVHNLRGQIQQGYRALMDQVRPALQTWCFLSVFFCPLFVVLFCYLSHNALWTHMCRHDVLCITQIASTHVVCIWTTQ